MDPSDPVKFASGKSYRFIRWEGAAAGSKRKVRVNVKGKTVLIARYEAAK
jgi:hypothetical protein